MYNNGFPYYRGHYPQYHPPPQYYSQRAFEEQRAAQERARVLAEQQGRRAQWLPEEDDDYTDDWEYNQLTPRERAYIDARRNFAIREREHLRAERENAAARERALEEQRWQQELEQRERQRLEQENERRRWEAQHQQQQNYYRARSHSRSRSRGPYQQQPSPNGYYPPFPQPQPYQQPVSPQPQPQQPTQSPEPEYTEKHAESTSTHQHHIQIQKSFETIRSLSEQFDTLRKEFTFPSTISFQDPSAASGNAINVSAIHTSDLDRTVFRSDNDYGDDEPMTTNAPKLAFNSTNYKLHAYMESLDTLLVKLDGVESWGEPDVRARRRDVVKRIGKQQARIDRFCKESWTQYRAAGQRSSAAY